VEPLPGATAIVPALVGSGLPTDEFVYLGFLPRKDRALRDFLSALSDETRTLVAYESPNRLLDTLASVKAVLGERQVCVARELSKMFEEFQRGTVGEVLEHFRQQPPRGEIVLVIAGAQVPAIAQWTTEQVALALRQRLEAGESLSSAARQVAAESGWERRAVYKLGTGDD
jgi:16S rRNA (cytidine1402-2'-O)-methyltransferase